MAGSDYYLRVAVDPASVLRAERTIAALGQNQAAKAQAATVPVPAAIRESGVAGLRQVEDQIKAMSRLKGVHQTMAETQLKGVRSVGAASREAARQTAVTTRASMGAIRAASMENLQYAAAAGGLKGRLAGLNAELIGASNTATGLGNALAAGQLSMRQFGAATLETAGRFTIYGAASTILFGTIATLGKIGSAAMEANEGLTNLTRVVDTIDMGTGTRQMVELMQDLNVGASDVSEAVFNMGKAFGDQEEAFEASRAVLLASKVAEIDVTQASMDLIKVQKSYKLEASELTDVVDKLNEEQNRLGITLPRTLTAIARSASVTAAAGGELDDLTARISVLNRVSGFAPEMVGRAMARISQTALSSERIKRVQDAIEGTGIHLIDAEGEIKNVDEILNMVGEKWSTFTKQQQSDVTEALTGGRQGGLSTMLFTMFNQWKNIQVEVEAVANSQGSAQRELTITLTATREVLKSLGVELETIGVNMAESGLLHVFGVVVASTRDALGVANELLGVYNRLPQAIKVSVAAFGAFKAAQFIGSRALTQGAIGMAGRGMAVAGSTNVDAAAARSAAIASHNVATLTTGVTHLGTSSTRAAASIKAATVAQSNLVTVQQSAALSATAQAKTQSEVNSAIIAGNVEAKKGLGGILTKGRVGIGGMIGSLIAQEVARQTSNNTVESAAGGAGVGLGVAGMAALFGVSGPIALLAGGATAAGKVLFDYHDKKAEQDKQVAVSFKELRRASMELSLSTNNTAEAVAKLGGVTEQKYEKDAKLDVSPYDEKRQAKGFIMRMTEAQAESNRRLEEEYQSAVKNLLEQNPLVNQETPFNVAANAAVMEVDYKKFNSIFKDVGIDISKEKFEVLPNDIEEWVREKLEQVGKTDAEIEQILASMSLDFRNEFLKSQAKGDKKGDSKISQLMQGIGFYKGVKSGSPDIAAIEDVENIILSRKADLESGDGKAEKAIDFIESREELFNAVGISSYRLNNALKSAAKSKPDFAGLDSIQQEITAVKNRMKSKYQDVKIEEDFGVSEDDIEAINNEAADNLNLYATKINNLATLLSNDNIDPSKALNAAFGQLQAVSEKAREQPGNAEIQLAYAQARESFQSMISQQVQSWTDLIDSNDSTPQDGLTSIMGFLNRASNMLGKAGLDSEQNAIQKQMTEATNNIIPKLIEERQEGIRVLINNTRNPVSRKRLKRSLNNQVNTLRRFTAASNYDDVIQALQILGFTERQIARITNRDAIRVAQESRRSTRSKMLAARSKLNMARAMLQSAMRDRASVDRIIAIGKIISELDKKYKDAQDDAADALRNLRKLKAEDIESINAIGRGLDTDLPPATPLDKAGPSAEDLKREAERAAEEARSNAMELIEARYDYLKALAGDDQVKIARLELREAKELARFARSKAERFRAKAAIKRAEDALRDAILGIAGGDGGFGLPNEIKLPTAFEVKAAASKGMRNVTQGLGEAVGALSSTSSVKNVSNRNTITINVNNEQDMKRVREVVYDATGEEIQRSRSIGFL